MLAVKYVINNRCQRVMPGSPAAAGGEEQAVVFGHTTGIQDTSFRQAGF